MQIEISYFFTVLLATLFKFAFLGIILIAINIRIMFLITGPVASQQTQRKSYVVCFPSIWDFEESCGPSSWAHIGIVNDSFSFLD